MQTSIDHELNGFNRLLKDKGFDQQVTAFRPSPVEYDTGIFLDFGNDCRALGTLDELGPIIEQADDINTLKHLLKSKHHLEE